MGNLETNLKDIAQRVAPNENQQLITIYYYDNRVFTVYRSIEEM